MKYYSRAIEKGGDLASPGARSPAYSRSKRALDVALSLAGLVFLLPLIAMVACLVKASGPGPVIFGHSRVGQFGREFRCYKFRTMVTDGDAVLAGHLSRNPAAREEWEASRKLRDDPRVTPVGAVLRRLSLDELPQLINILRGEMSVVGPRPVVRDELEHYGTSAAFYLRTRPGLTGLWQISGRNDVCYSTRIALDRRYVETWSLAGDVEIIVRTIPAVIASRGSY